jgi:hypothetical protein
VRAASLFDARSRARAPRCAAAPAPAPRLLFRWVKIRADGSNEWLFEVAAAGAPAPRPLDSRIFWWALYGAPAVWAALVALAVIRLQFDWALVTAVGAGLTGANLVGYYRCSSESARQRLRATLASGAAAGLAYLPGPAAALGSTFLSAFAAAPPAPAPAAAAAKPRAADDDRVGI